MRNCGWNCVGLRFSGQAGDSAGVSNGAVWACDRTGGWLGRKLAIASLVAICGGAMSLSAQVRQDRPEEAEQAKLDAEREAMIEASAGAAAPAPGLFAQPEEGAAGFGRQTVMREAAASQATEDKISFSQFTEAIELTMLVNFTAEILGLNVVVAPDLSGTVAFNDGFEVSRDELLSLVNWLLEQNGFSMTQGQQGFYAVVRSNVIPPDLNQADGPLSSTRVFRTRNVRPSGLQTAITTVLGAGQGAAGRIAYLDELGIIIATDTPGRVRAIADLIDRLDAEEDLIVFEVIELRHISATRALERINTIIASTAGTTTAAQQQPQPGGQQGGQQRLPAASSGLLSLPSRLTAAQGSNALLFRGRADELDECLRIVELVDRTSNLKNRRYFCGSATASIAELAVQQGLGEITRFQDSTQQQQGQGVVVRAGNVVQLGGQQQTDYAGGPVLVVNEAQGYIVAYLTDEQHAKLSSLVDEFRPEDEALVIREYKLEHAGAEESAEILRSVILGEQQTGATALLPGQQRGTQARPTTQQSGGQTPSGETAFTGNPEDVLITADIGNNQLLIRAPIRQQSEIQRIIGKIDVRRPQVFIDVKIVTITKNDEFRLAFETQLINAGGSGGLIQQNFGLTSPGGGTATGGGDITLPRVVAAGLQGVTGAVILSDYVPIVINAIQNVTDARIVANPVLLVDDNEEAVVVSLEQQPVTTTSTGTATTNVTFDRFEDAGTSLTVTPRISAGGYLRLSYEITLSNFVGSSTAPGVPPPRQERTVRANSVTIPSDRTIVVGGIIVDDESQTILKVPLLGDIPLVGELFKSRNNRKTESIVYVFITPRILSDARFGGHSLVTEGPRKVSGVLPDAPPVRPVATTTMTGASWLEPSNP